MVLWTPRLRFLYACLRKPKHSTKKPHDGHDVHTLLVDLVSAFDNVPHALIELKLKKMGAPEAFCHWIRNLIHKQTRFCSTAFNPGDPNDTMTLQGGVPQGCPLSPILFVIFFDIVISSLHTTLGDTGCSLGAALIQSILFGDDTTGAAPNFKDLQKMANIVGPDCASCGIRCNTFKSLYAAGCTPRKPQTLFLPSLDERGIFSCHALPTVLAFPATNRNKDPRPHSFRILGIHLQRAASPESDAWQTQRNINTHQLLKFSNLTNALVLSKSDMTATAAVATHLIPKTCFASSKAIFDLNFIEAVRLASSTAMYKSVGVHSSNALSSAAAFISDKGSFSGMGTPDPLTWILRAHLLNLLTALNSPPNSPLHCAYAFPLHYIQSHPDDTTSFITMRNLCSLMTRYGISLHFGHPSRTHHVPMVPSPKAVNLSIIANLPPSMLFRALNNKEQTQLTQRTHQHQPSFGPTSILHPLTTIRNAVDFGSRQNTHTTSFTLCPFVAAWYAFHSPSAQERSIVLINRATLSGHIYDLSNQDGRAQALLTSRGQHLAAKSREVIASAQPVPVLSSSPSSALTQGMSIEVKFEDTARALDDSAVLTMVNMIPRTVLQNPRKQSSNIPTAVLSCDGSLLPSPASGRLSSFWEMLPEENAHAKDIFMVMHKSATLLLNSLNAQKKVHAWIFMPTSTKPPLYPGWIFVTISPKNTHLHKPIPFHLFTLPSVDVTATPLSFQQRRKHSTSQTPATLANVMKLKSLYSDTPFTPLATPISLNLSQIIFHFDNNWPSTSLDINEVPIPNIQPAMNSFFHFRLELKQTMLTIGRYRIIHWLFKSGFPMPSSTMLEILRLNSLEFHSQQTPFPKEHLLATIWIHSSSLSPLLPPTSPLCTCLPLHVPMSTMKPCRRHSSPVPPQVLRKAKERKSRGDDAFPGFPCTCRKPFHTTASRDNHILTEMSENHAQPTDTLPVRVAATLIELPSSIETAAAFFSVLPHFNRNVPSSTDPEIKALEMGAHMLKLIPDLPLHTTISSDSTSALLLAQKQQLTPQLLRKHLESSLCLSGQHLNKLLESLPTTLHYTHTPAAHNHPHTADERYSTLSKANNIVDQIAHGEALKVTEEEQQESDHRFFSHPVHLENLYFLCHSGVIIEGHYKTLLRDLRDHEHVNALILENTPAAFWPKLALEIVIHLPSTAAVRNRMSEHTRRSALRSLARVHPCLVFKTSFHSPDYFSKRILKMPLAPILTCEKCAISWDTTHKPFLASHPTQTGLPHFYTCPHRRQHRNSQEAFWILCLLSHAPPMPHVPQITTPEDFIKSDPSLPIPQGIRRTSEHDPDSFTILAGTFRHRLPKSLINAYASFVRDTQNESASLETWEDFYPCQSRQPA